MIELEIEGMSSLKNRIFLNELIFPDTRYLEIGVYKGSTFVSALARNTFDRAIAIDDFSQFDDNRVNFETFKNNCANSSINGAVVINHDCFSIIPDEKKIISKINTYFYDGDHREIDQKRAITEFINEMDNVFIFIVDDWNHDGVETGTRQGIEACELKIHKEWVLPAAYNGDREQWWNGLYVAVLEK